MLEMSGTITPSPTQAEMDEDYLPFPTRRQVRELLDENDALKREVHRLRAILAPVTCMPRYWGLTVKEQTLIDTLRKAAPEVVTREQMIGALYVREAEPGDLRTVYVFIANIRRKLRDVGFDLEIKGHYGTGWSLSATDRDRIAGAIEADRTARARPMAA